MVRFHGLLYAAGSYFPGSGPIAPGYPTGGLPMVWRSGGSAKHWVLVWQAGGVVLGSGGFSELVATPHDLWLFEGDTGGTAAWRWGWGDGTGFRREPLPPAMAAMEVTAVVWGHGRLLAVEANKYAGGPVSTFGNGDAVWSSVDGTSWRRGVMPGGAVLRSLTVTPSGFVAGGESRTTQTSTVWASAHGAAWRATRLAGQGSVALASRGTTVVAFDPQAGTLWRSAAGAPWYRSTVTGPAGGLPTMRSEVPGRALTTGPHGFLLAGRDPATWWWSATGTRWVRPARTGAPGTATVTGIFPDRSGLLVVGTRDSEAGGPPVFWQVTVRASASRPPTG